MAFPIHPNNYQSTLPAPFQPEESNIFSESIRRVRRFRGAAFECATLALVWADIGLVTHQIVLDVSLSYRNATSEGNSSLSQWTLDAADFSNDHPALTHEASVALFIAITAMSFLFLLETVARNIYTRVVQRRFNPLNVCDAALCTLSFGLNATLLAAGVSPLARDFVALLISFRLVRSVALAGGLTGSEKQQVLCMLDSYRREETYTAEQRRMLRTELENRTRECNDLRELVKSATLSRNRLKQKQQLQMQQQSQQANNNNVSKESSTDTDGSGGAMQEDSGHSSDSSPDYSPQDPTRVGVVGTTAAGGRDAARSVDSAGTPTDIELVAVAAGRSDTQRTAGSVTSRM